MKSRNKSVVKFSLYLHSFSKFFLVYPKSYIQIFICFAKFYFLNLSESEFKGKLVEFFGECGDMANISSTCNDLVIYTS